MVFRICIPICAFNATTVVNKIVLISSYHRAIIRKHNCLYVLLRQLTSPSLTVVSNACGTLWNLSARCAEDQRTLISLGAMDMLRSLTHSKHKMISMACAAALKNLMNARLDIEVNKEDDRICDSSLLSPKRHLFEREIGDRLQENNGNSSSSYKGVLASKSNVDEVYNFGESSSCHPIVNFADRSQREIFKKGEYLFRKNVVPHFELSHTVEKIKMRKEFDCELVTYLLLIIRVYISLGEYFICLYRMILSLTDVFEIIPTRGRFTCELKG